jgi:hypothetical protein
VEAKAETLAEGISSGGARGSSLVDEESPGLGQTSCPFTCNCFRCGEAGHRAQECPHHERQPAQHAVSAITAEVGYEQRDDIMLSAVQDAVNVAWNVLRTCGLNGVDGLQCALGSYACTSLISRRDAEPSDSVHYSVYRHL